MSDRGNPTTRGVKADNAVVQERDQNSLYGDAVAALGSALERLARSYEIDPSKRQDLLQDIHLNLWRSLARFDGRCSLRTWVYRVAHNVGASHVISEHRFAAQTLVGLDALEFDSFTDDPSDDIDRERLLARLLKLIDRLRPVDRQLVTLYLEGLDATAMSEITGISSGNVATKISRLKKLLRAWAKESGE